MISAPAASPPSELVYVLAASGPATAATTFTIPKFTNTETYQGVTYDCYLPEVLTFDPDLSGYAWISVSDRTISLYSTDTNLSMETVTVTVTSTITTRHPVTD